MPDYKETVNTVIKGANPGISPKESTEVLTVDSEQS